MKEVSNSLDTRRNCKEPDNNPALCLLLGMLALSVSGGMLFAAVQQAVGLAKNTKTRVQAHQVAMRLIENGDLAQAQQVYNALQPLKVPGLTTIKNALDAAKARPVARPATPATSTCAAAAAEVKKNAAATEEVGPIHGPELTAAEIERRKNGEATGIIHSVDGWLETVNNKIEDLESSGSAKAPAYRERYNTIASYWATFVRQAKNLSKEEARKAYNLERPKAIKDIKDLDESIDQESIPKAPPLEIMHSVEDWLKIVRGKIDGLEYSNPAEVPAYRQRYNTIASYWATFVRQAKNLSKEEARKAYNLERPKVVADIKQLDELIDKRLIPGAAGHPLPLVVAVPIEAGAARSGRREGESPAEKAARELAELEAAEEAERKEVSPAKQAGNEAVSQVKNLFESKLTSGQLIRVEARARKIAEENYASSGDLILAVDAGIAAGKEHAALVTGASIL